MRAELLVETAEVPDKKENYSLLKEVMGIGSRRFRKILEGGVKHWARPAAAAGIVITSLFFPVDTPTPIQAETKQASAYSPLLLEGDGSRNRQTFLVMGASPEIRRRIASALFFISPLDEYRNISNVYGTSTSVDLGCNQRGQCNEEVVTQVIKDVSAATGRVYQETIVAVVSQDPFAWNGWTPRLESNKSAPSIFTYSAVVFPEKNEINKMINDSLFDLADARAVAHEAMHSYGGEGHGGGDIMDEPENCQPTNMCFSFNEGHRQLLKNLKEIVPLNYWMPKLGGGSDRSVQSINQAKQLDKMEIPITEDIPLGAKWIKFEVTQEDGPAITLLYADKKILDQLYDRKFMVESPKMGVGNYILKPDQLVRERIWVSNQKQMPEWNSPAWDWHKAWPDLAVPSNRIERYYITPKRLADKINIATLSGKPVVDSLTPTLIWINTDEDVYDYEIELSSDPDFEKDPQKAKAAVYNEIRHGGMTKPLNSYTVPNNYPLEPDKTYNFRVRPRNLHTEVPWSSVATFKTLPDAAIKHSIIEQVKQAKEEETKTYFKRSDLPDCMPEFIPQQKHNSPPFNNCYRLLGRWEEAEE